jgi:glycosyltransferase involved in cell wall biosynthesis
VSKSTSQTPRVLHVANYAAPHIGGVELHMHTLCRELAKHLEVHEIGGGGPRFSSRGGLLDGVPVTRLATPLTLRSTSIAPTMPLAIRAKKADLVHLHFPNPFGAAAYILSRHRGPLVVTWHFEVVRQRWLNTISLPYVRRALQRSSAIVTTSPKVADAVAALQPFRDRLRVIPYGIDYECLEQHDHAAVRAIRDCYGPRIVLGVGRLIYYKGWEYLLDAMREVNAKLLIAGDGPLREAMERQIEREHLGDRVVLLGMKSPAQLTPLYQACEVFVLASTELSEAFGIVQLEAMAAGKPVINTMLDSGVPFVSRHGESGLTVAPRDSNALAAAINRMLEDPVLRQSYGQAGRRRVQRDFSVKRMTSDTLELYGEVLGYSPPIAQSNKVEPNGRYAAGRR